MTGKQTGTQDYLRDLSGVLVEIGTPLDDPADPPAQVGGR